MPWVERKFTWFRPNGAAKSNQNNFGEASMENVKAIKTILRTFELVSSLKINFVKSCFGAFGMSDQWKLDAANYLNCSLLSIPFVYLGIPIGANPR